MNKPPITIRSLMYAVSDLKKVIKASYDDLSSEQTHKIKVSIQKINMVTSGEIDNGKFG